MCEVICAVFVYALVGRTRTKLKLKLIELDPCVFQMPEKHEGFFFSVETHFQVQQLVCFHYP